MRGCTYLLGNNIELDVEFIIMLGRPATLEDPAEDAEIHIESVTYNGKDFEIDDLYIGDNNKTAQWLPTAITDYINENLDSLLEVDCEA
jgi:hypothetical protein